MTDTYSWNGTDPQPWPPAPTSGAPAPFWGPVLQALGHDRVGTGDFCPPLSSWFNIWWW